MTACFTVGLLSLILSIHSLIWFKISDFAYARTTSEFKVLFPFLSWFVTVAITYVSLELFLAQGAYFSRFALSTHRDPLLIPPTIVFGLNGLFWTAAIYRDRLKKLSLPKPKLH